MVYMDTLYLLYVDMHTKGLLCVYHLHSGPSMVYMDTMSGQCTLVVIGDTMDIECTD